jgi:hypothetical protein
MSRILLTLAILFKLLILLTNGFHSRLDFAEGLPYIATARVPEGPGHRPYGGGHSHE